MDEIITLLYPGETSEEDAQENVFATVEPVGRDEFNAAAQNGFTAKHKFLIWQSEYNEEPKLIYGDKILTIYRTYGPRADGKVELYAGERLGNR